MTDPKTLIDTKKHLLWSGPMEEAVRNDIKKRWPEKEDEIFRKTVLEYAEYLKSQPYIGGKKNQQAMGVYDTIFVCAYYTATGSVLSNLEIEEIMDERFIAPYRKMGRIMNLNRKPFLNLMQLAFRKIEKNIKKHEKDWPGNYHMEVLPLDREKGVRYRFHSCPIADFAKRNHLEHLAGALCNSDYPMLKEVKASLIRENTCMNGPCCDYWILGDKNPYSGKYPEFRDREGYIRNRITDEKDKY